MSMTAALPLLALLLSAPAPPAPEVTLVTPATGSGPYDYELRKVAEGVFVAVRPDVFRQPVEPNVTLIVNEQDVVVVDAGGTTASAESILRLLKSVTDKPVRYLVNTHWHGDHNLGNHVFQAAFPGVDIIAHPNTRENISIENIGLGTLGEQLSGFIKDLKQGIETGKDPEGKPMAADRIERWKKLLVDTEIAQAESKRTKVLLPNVTVNDSLVIRRGSRDIQIRYLGRGNTDGDLIVYLPKERVLMTGDLVVHPQPYGFGSYPQEWPETLEKLAMTEFRTLVPGHGAIQHDASYIRKLQALIEKERAEVTALVKGGATLKDARERLDVGPELTTTFTEGDARRQTLLKGWFLDPFAASVYKEAKGEDIVQGSRE